MPGVARPAGTAGHVLRGAARAAVRTFLADQGVPDPDGRTATLLAWVDGLVFDRLVGGGEVRVDEVQGLVAAALHGAAGR
ncbi:MULTISPECIES: hypothetical protein [unclassified Kitasatospora]|uniref:hypothetical protein n=1 Tax=unclassified Kitasatospora TaxID=2633591 RepID=UPI003824B056